MIIQVKLPKRVNFFILLIGELNRISGKILKRLWRHDKVFIFIQIGNRYHLDMFYIFASFLFYIVGRHYRRDTWINKSASRTVGWERYCKIRELWFSVANSRARACICISENKRGAKNIVWEIRRSAINKSRLMHAYARAFRFLDPSKIVHYFLSKRSITLSHFTIGRTWRTGWVFLSNARGIFFHRSDLTVIGLSWVQTNIKIL